MKLEHDRELCAKYPKLFSQRDMPMDKTAMCWGFQCGDGWYTLIDKLAEFIQWNVDENKHLQRFQPEVTTVKEKYGTLRFYVNNLDEYSDGAVAFAERLSGYICETCGKPGTLNNGPWYETRCEEHNND